VTAMSKPAQILCLGDLYLPAEKIAAVVHHRLVDVETTAVDWPLADLGELAAKNLLIEQGGPAAVTLPNSITDLLGHRCWDAVLTHFAPLAEGAVSNICTAGWIGVLRGGIENVDLQACIAQGVTVINSPGRNANAVAEFTIGLILAETRHIARAHKLLQEGCWEKEFGRPLPQELCELVVGIVGYGAIGRLVAAKLTALGTRVLAYDPALTRQPANPAATGIPSVEFTSLDHLLAISDVVTLHARYSGTQPLLGKRELSLMKRGAYLINTARAELVDYQALMDALASGHLTGAAIDVFPEEPVPIQAPWLHSSRLTLTPHLGGATANSFWRSPGIAIDCLAAITSGQSHPGTVYLPKQHAVAFRRRWAPHLRSVSQ